jgi:hypothetical protein
MLTTERDCPKDLLSITYPMKQFSSRHDTYGLISTSFRVYSPTTRIARVTISQ